MNRDTRWNPNLAPTARFISDINHSRQVQSFHFKEIVSISHVMGSITSFLVEYIRSAFPENFIGTTWTTTEELFSQRAHKFKDILSKPRPIMTVDPKFELSDDAQFIPHREFDSLVANDPTSNIWSSVRQSDPLILGENFELYHKLRRMKMDFNINFIFDSDIKRMEAQEFIRMNIRHMVPIIVHRYLENNIPDNFMDAIAQMTGFDKNSEEFLIYLNNRSNAPITRRLRTGSQTLEFFSMQHSPLDIRFNDLPSSNGPVKRGNIIVSSSFSESVTVEFVMDSMYFLTTNTKIKPLQRVAASETIHTVGESFTKNDVIYENDIVTYIPEIPFEENNCIKLTTITVQADENGDDTINLFHLLNGEIANLFKSYKESKKPIDFFHIAVLESPDHRIGGERMIFDPETLDLTIKKMDIYKSYYITLYLDKQKIHKTEMLNFETDKYNRI